jgi:hypothetical protein
MTAELFVVEDAGMGKSRSARKAAAVTNRCTGPGADSDPAPVNAGGAPVGSAHTPRGQRGERVAGRP